MKKNLGRTCSYKADTERKLTVLFDKAI